MENKSTEHCQQQEGNLKKEKSNHEKEISSLKKVMSDYKVEKKSKSEII